MPRSFPGVLNLEPECEAGNQVNVRFQGRFEPVVRNIFAAAQLESADKIQQEVESGQVDVDVLNVFLVREIL